MKKFLELESYEGTCPHCRSSFKALWKCKASVEKYSKIFYFCTSCNKVVLCENGSPFSLHRQVYFAL